MNVLEVSSLWKTYEGASPYTALEDVSLNVAKGEFVGIMGPSGSGKSTLLNVVSTVDQPSRGTVRVDGVDPHGLGDEKLAEFRRRKMGFVFQDFNLVHTLTVEENIILPLALDGWPAEKSRARAQELARPRHRIHSRQEDPRDIGWPGAARRDRPRGGGKPVAFACRRANGKSRLRVDGAGHAPSVGHEQGRGDVAHGHARAAGRELLQQGPGASGRPHLPRDQPRRFAEGVPSADHRRDEPARRC